MIDSEFIIKYTNALYNCPEEQSPRYDEFRDMFSLGQIASKTWLATELKKINLPIKTICLCGAWFGTLAFYLKKSLNDVKINCIDLDPRCEFFIKNLSGLSQDNVWLSAKTANMQNYELNEDCIVNTSCEHIDDLTLWLKKIPSGRTVVLQSTNYKKPIDHISTVDSVDEFLLKTEFEFNEIYFSGTLDVGLYKRFMIIGKV